MPLRSLVLLLGGVLALATGEAAAQACPTWMPGTLVAANCAAKSHAQIPVPSLGSLSGYALSSNWSVGAHGGGITGAATPDPVLQFRDGLDRNYASADVTGAYWFGRSQFATRFSFNKGVDRLSAFGLGSYNLPDYRNNWSQTAATARYGYWFDGFMPYASLTLSSNLAAGDPALQGAGGGLIPRLGVDFFSKRDLSGGFSYSAEQGSVVKNQVWSANLNFRF